MAMTLCSPGGTNKYLGILDVEGIELSTNSTFLPNTAVSSPTSIEEEPKLDKDVLTLEEAFTHDVAFGSLNIDHDPTIPSTLHPDTLAFISGPGINSNNYLLVHGNLSIDRSEFIASVLPRLIVNCSWLWMGDYVKMCSEIQGIKQTTEEVVEITVPGLLFFTLNNLWNTWIIEELALSLTSDTLWHNASLRISSTFLPLLIFLCFLMLFLMVQQVSFVSSIYILQVSCGVTSINNNLKQQVGLHQPCGFCRQSGHQECKIQIKITNSGAILKVDSFCPYAHTFWYSNANIGSNNRPCHNVPLNWQPALGNVMGTSDSCGLWVWVSGGYKAKAAVDERLKITSKKRKNTDGSNRTIHTQPKKAKSTQEHGINGVEEAPHNIPPSTEPHSRTIEQAPPKAHLAPSQQAAVHSEDKDEVVV
ncbi:hypothetical protein BDR06DRAFT_972303 [Suillus hirtellus]|nr:hypothetical protein BDR06DRAFT_972303 [Suillus hirtellus]